MFQALLASKSRLTVAAFGILVLFLILAAVLLALPPHVVKPLVAEDALIENLSALFLVVGLLFAVAQAERTRSPLWVAVSLMMLWMLLRELDMQKRFTPRSIESIGFYSNPSIPLGVKLLALLAMTPFVLSGLYLVTAAIKAIRVAPKCACPWLPAGSIAAALLVSAHLFEKRLPRAWRVLEEPAELAFIALIVFAVIDCARHQTPRPIT